MEAVMFAVAAAAGHDGIGFISWISGAGAENTGAGTGASFFASAFGSIAGFAAPGLAVGADATVAAPFAGSPLRSNPRATRNVPLDCSILMGLVRTRLAPMRNALATPA